MFRSLRGWMLVEGFVVCVIVVTAVDVRETAMCDIITHLIIIETLNEFINMAIHWQQRVIRAMDIQNKTESKKKNTIFTMFYY